MKPTLQLTQNYYESYMYHELVTCYSPLSGTREQYLLECHLVLDWLIVFAVPQFVSKEPFVAALIKEQFCHLVPLKSCYGSRVFTVREPYFEPRRFLRVVHDAYNCSGNYV